MQTLSTPAFLTEATRHGFNFLPLLALLGGRGKEPTWVVGKPGLKEPKLEDQGRTLKVPAPFAFYIIRDDYADDAPEFAGESIITTLLCSEY